MKMLMKLLLFVFLFPVMPIFGVMGILQGVLGGITTPAKVETGRPFKTSLIPTDGDLGAGEPAAMIAILAAVNAGVNVLIWTMTVPAQQQVRWGFGSPATPMNQGYMWWGFSSGAAYIEGKLRLVQANARHTEVYPVAELDVNQLHDDVAFTVLGMRLINKNDMQALPEKREFKKVGENSMLELWFECTTAVAVTVGDFSIPITAYQ